MESNHHPEIGRKACAESSCSEKGRIRELFTLFVRLGFTAFGGPAAHIAIFEEEVVRRRGWLTHAQFLDLLGVTNLIPGPNSTEMAIHIGHFRAGFKGMVVSGASFILPAAFIVSVFAWIYVHFGSLPQAQGLLFGVKPVVIAIILQALWVLGKKALTTRAMAVVAGGSAVAVLLGGGELGVLLAAGAAMAVFMASKSGPRAHGRGLTVLFVGVALFFAVSLMLPTAETSGARPFSLTALFLFFFKVGSVLYGSGYVLLAFIESGLVNQWGWITQTQLLDAVAVGQVTPGPLFTTATFIGYLLAGGVGAAVGSLGIFLPSFIFVALSGPLIPKIRASVLAGAFLDGVNAASLALMAVVTMQLGVGTLRDPLSIIIALVSAVLLFRYKVSATWLIAGGALLGLAVAFL
jgi:chromate transporter